MAFKNPKIMKKGLYQRPFFDPHKTAHRESKSLIAREAQPIIPASPPSDAKQILVLTATSLRTWMHQNHSPKITL